MQIKTNWKKKNHYLIWQKNIPTIIINCISILVLSAIIVVTPSLSASQSSQTNSSTVITTAQHNMVKLLADMVRNKLHGAVNLLEITSKDPVIQNVSFANFISKKYMGIPSTMDLPKRKLAQDILVRDKDFGNVYFVTPKADIYIGEPFSAGLLMRFFKNRHLEPTVRSLCPGGAILLQPLSQERQSNGYQSYQAS